MNREYYLQLAESGLRMPIGTDLVLHEQPDRLAVLTDGRRLGQVLEQTARRYHTPLAFPHMDLELEKHQLLHMLDVPSDQWAKFHFDVISDEVLAAVDARLGDPMIPALQAHVDSVRYITEETDLLPMGMVIGPFSLMTKLISDPITPIALAGSGLTAEDDDEVALVERALELSMRIILLSLRAQIDAGARAIFVAEPAANKVYLSPKQIEAGADIFERYVMQPNLRLTQEMAQHHVDLMFHCCGELTDKMLAQFCRLNPAILSLGSSRVLWEDAAIVPKDIVLYGNLPSKRFYSDDLISVADVMEQGERLVTQMRQAGHPFILGSECDILSVPGCHETIALKAQALAMPAADRAAEGAPEAVATV